MPSRYASSLDLARLPWFEVRDGRLVAMEDIGPVVDVHTHLALTYARRTSVDLHAAPRPPFVRCAHAARVQK